MCVTPSGASKHCEASAILWCPLHTGVGGPHSLGCMSHIFLMLSLFSPSMFSFTWFSLPQCSLFILLQTVHVGLPHQVFIQFGSLLVHNHLYLKAKPSYQYPLTYYCSSRKSAFGLMASEMVAFTIRQFTPSAAKMSLRAGAQRNARDGNVQSFLCDGGVLL